MKSLFTSSDEIAKQQSQSGKPYLEFLRVDAMSAGLYVLAPGAQDLQQPHHQDEIYYVIRGRANFHCGVDDSENDREVSAGSVIFVAAGVEHRFHDVTEELAALVIFAPAET